MPWSETAMFLPRRLFYFPLFVAGALNSAPFFAASNAHASSAKATTAKTINAKNVARAATERAAAPRQFDIETGGLNQSDWKYDFAEEELESRWSFRGDANFTDAGEIRIVFGWKDAQNTAFLSVARTKNGVEGALIPISHGKITPGKAEIRFVLPSARGELGLQKVGNRSRVLWNGNVVAHMNLALPGAQFGTATRGAAKFVADAPQPTENVILRDDFMRAQGPNEAEIPGEWKVAGVWKTSGTLGPRSDAALNPNPFVFRAQGRAASGNVPLEAENLARAGKWWWGDYSVSASVRATKNESKMPLRAGLEAFAQGDRDGVRGEIDFSRGLVTLKSGSTILSQNRVAIETDQWHRLRLEPGPGVAKFWVDGVLCVQAPSRLAQGGVSLRAVSGADALVDFDDVRVGQRSASEWGEGALPKSFQKDRLMSNWASNAKSWTRDEKGIWWHTGDFFGASQLSFPLANWKFGQSAAILWTDKTNKNPLPAALISRENDGYSLSIRGWNGEKTAPIQWKSGATGAVLTLKMSLLKTKRATLGVFVDGKQLAQRQVLAPVGNKIGVRPLQGGQSVPPPSLQPFSLESTTFERQNRAAIGVNITPVSAEIARRIGLSDAFGAIVDNVETDSPAQKAGIREGDVIRGVDGAQVTDVESMRVVVGAAKPEQILKIAILRPQTDASGFDWAACVASTPQVLDYSFTAAPTDWQAARGTWNVAERWTCSPQWSFFAGQNDASPLLWSRFATRGDWTLEAYLASPMDLTRGERSPSDLNLTVGADGQDLSSGYSFIFGGKGRSVNQVRRGDAVVWEKPFEMPPSGGDIHQDWFYIRLERRQTPQGARFRYMVNGREIANYLDPKPLTDGGHIGFWTQNGGMSIARIRLWHAGLREPRNKALSKGVLVARDTSAISVAVSPIAISKPVSNGLGIWSARGEGRELSTQLISLPLSPSSEAAHRQTLQITNPRSGGDWTTYVTRARFNALQKPVLEWNYRVPEGVKVNVYVQISGIWHEIGFTSSHSNAGDGRQLGRIEDVLTDGKWHHARFDLGQALRNKSLGETWIEAVAFAAPDQDYLRAGLGGNHRGATYWLRDFSAGKFN